MDCRYVIMYDDYGELHFRECESKKDAEIFLEGLESGRYGDDITIQKVYMGLEVKFEKVEVATKIRILDSVWTTTTLSCGVFPNEEILIS